MSEQPRAIDKVGSGTVRGKKPKKGKGSAVLIRVTQDTRDALEREAERTGRSLSQAAEIWLDAASKGNASYQELLGGTSAVAAGIEKLVEIARIIDGKILDKMVANFAIRAAWQKAIPAVVPTPTLSDAMLDKLAASRRAWKACREVQDVLNEQDETNPVRCRLRSPLYGAPGASGSPTIVANRLAEVLEPRLNHPVLVAGPNEVVIRALEELKSVGDTARGEIDLALTDVRASMECSKDIASTLAEAVELGEDIAAAVTQP